jgi:sterol desaturase/sphingolipid hydroxylase (fatty acid hydroxylase superfamily)
MKHILKIQHRSNPKNYRLYSLLLFLVLIHFVVLLSYSQNELLFQVGYFICGWISWTYGEYYWHRFLMHVRNKTISTGAQGSHLHHHQHPTDLKIKQVHRIFMTLIFLLLIVLSAILKNYVTCFTGFYFGFILYSYVHVLLHREWAATLFPRLLRYHVYHHCKYPNLCFGVSVPWWDDFFGTVPPKGVVIPKRILVFYFKEPQHPI